ncbi:MAG: Unknown protein [uncultured Thiotrichaceae bacterium]|uniref:Mechanosensitive ion channel n=1 Tax=uncultured Thiotrichaceae bacterium TaxID=298394 RepID=A0A6S6SJE6_9GAMM|nr:MAG: Unknown protein [uncultured Thiotrichaceae bacterium]
MLKTLRKSRVGGGSYMSLQWIVVVLIGFLFSINFLYAEPVEAELSEEDANLSIPVNELKTLQSLLVVKTNLSKEIKLLGKELAKTVAPSEKQIIDKQLESLGQELAEINLNFEQIATDLHSAAEFQDTNKKFNLKEDLGSLVEPIVQEMKHLTSPIREKNRFRDEITISVQQMLNALAAKENLKKLLEHEKDKNLKAELTSLERKWKRRYRQAESRNNLAQAQLDMLEAAEANTTFLQSSKDYFREFFQKRGLYLLLGFGSFLGVLLTSKLIYKYIIRHLPGMEGVDRSFRQRLIDLVYRSLTIALSIMAPMMVFYAFGDWLLFSLGLLILIGLAWGLKYTVPKMWHQALLLLNIGAVREGERVFLDGLPWRVKSLNVYSELDNPISGLRIRIPIESLVDEVSRPIAKGEPWFPCKKSDWVILSDGVRGKVVGISQEMIELVERGGAKVNYQMQDFLSSNPRNLSTSFRLKEIIGISYDLQAECTGEVLEKLSAYLEEQIRHEGYDKSLLNLRVEFEQANASSLDIVIIADFKGDLADIYNRMRRNIRRWSVDACTKYDWEIPFTQLTLHQK